MNTPMGVLSRRDFLKASGALVISAAAPMFAADTLAQSAGAAAGKPALVPTELDSWVAILPDGRVSVFFGKMDMGQSLDIAIAQIVAEELDVPVARVDVYMGDSGTSCNQGGASGSFGVMTGAKPLRNAACEARRVLLERASRQLGVPASTLVVNDGVISVAGDTTRRTTYAELIGGGYFHHPVEWNKQVGNFMDIKVEAKPKSPSEYKIVGQSVARRDVEGKVFGTADFVTDISVPGMLHARMIRPPRAACSIIRVDESSIKTVPGARVIREKELLAVVAEREWDAVRAAQMLKRSRTHFSMRPGYGCGECR